MDKSIISNQFKLIEQSVNLPYGNQKIFFEQIINPTKFLKKIDNDFLLDQISIQLSKINKSLPYIEFNSTSTILNHLIFKNSNLYFYLIETNQFNTYLKFNNTLIDNQHNNITHYLYLGNKDLEIFNQNLINLAQFSSSSNFFFNLFFEQNLHKTSSIELMILDNNINALELLFNNTKNYYISNPQADVILDIISDKRVNTQTKNFLFQNIKITNDLDLNKYIQNKNIDKENLIDLNQPIALTKRKQNI